MNRRATVAARRRPGMGLPMGASILLHATVVGLIAVAAQAGAGRTVAMPPVYEVSLVAAPAGPRQAGVVRPPSTDPVPPPPEEPLPTPAAPEQVQPTTMPPLPTSQPAQRPPQPATPNVTEQRVAAAEPPVAGGGPEGGRGTDVANVQLRGIQFPYQGYLDNVVRQVAVRFRPQNARSYVAEVFFKINRDGSVADLRLVKRSGDFLFDQEALGAIEAAGKAFAFGPLPDGFSDDILPVFFSFDPNLIR